MHNFGCFGHRKALDVAQDEGCAVMRGQAQECRADHLSLLHTFHDSLLPHCFIREGMILEERKLGMPPLSSPVVGYLVGSNGEKPRAQAALPPKTTCLPHCGEECLLDDVFRILNDATYLMVNKSVEGIGMFCYEFLGGVGIASAEAIHQRLVGRKWLPPSNCSVGDEGENPAPKRRLSIRDRGHNSSLECGRGGFDGNGIINFTTLTRRENFTAF